MPLSLFLIKPLFRNLFCFASRSCRSGFGRSSLISSRSFSRSGGRSFSRCFGRCGSRCLGRSFSRSLSSFLSAANERNRAQEKQESKKFFHDSNAVLFSNKKMLQLVQLTNNNQNHRFFKKTLSTHRYFLIGIFYSHYTFLLVATSGIQKQRSAAKGIRQKRLHLLSCKKTEGRWKPVID